MRIDAPALPILTAPELNQATPESRALVPLERSNLPVATEIEVIDAEPIAKGAGNGRYDVRALSPRQAIEMSTDLYVSGVLSYDEHALLAYQPELQPDYNETIGALTGQKAEPDRPRDFIAHWEDRLSFEIAHNGDNTELVDRTERILGVLRQIDSPTDFLV
ncbi:MAG: hypothetical protein ACPGOV_06925 [Magnetovibrionaceae bacterium]